jgi:hypothetical protein
MNKNVEFAQCVKSLACAECSITETGFDDMKAKGPAARARQLAAVVLVDANVEVRHACNGLGLGNRGTWYSLLRAGQNLVKEKNSDFTASLKHIKYRLAGLKLPPTNTSASAQPAPIFKETNPDAKPSGESGDLVLFNLIQLTSPERIATHLGMTENEALIAVGRVAAKFGGDTVRMEQAITEGAKILKKNLLGL